MVIKLTDRVGEDKVSKLSELHGKMKRA